MFLRREDSGFERARSKAMCQMVQKDGQWNDEKYESERETENTFHKK